MTTLKHCPGYPGKFASLVDALPPATAYPTDKFRVEWGPIFHRGRLDGTAQVLAVGQDPAAHESFVRRILVGEAGQRVQGFLKKLGVTRHYVMINASLFSEYVTGTAIATYVETNAEIAADRAKWIDEILKPGKIKAVLLFGDQAKGCWATYATTRSVPASIVVVQLMHPTSDHGGSKTPLVTSWNHGMQQLATAGVTFHDTTPDTTPYVEATFEAANVEIPDFDLPAGLPEWMRSLDTWAWRPDPATPADPATTARYKRGHLLVEVPDAELG